MRKFAFGSDNVTFWFSFPLFRCLFEFMCSHNAHKPITIMLPERQEKKFAENLKTDWGVVYKALATIDSRNAKAREPDDLRAINQLIQDTVTHSELNKMAMEKVLAWLVETGLEQERRLQNAGDNVEARTKLADFQYALCIMLWQLGHLDEGERVARESLQSREETLGPKHPDTLLSVNNLASLLQEQGKLGEAEPLFRRALQGSEETLGPKHQDTLNTRGNLGSLTVSVSEAA